MYYIMIILYVLDTKVTKDPILVFQLVKAGFYINKGKSRRAGILSYPAKTLPEFN